MERSVVRKALADGFVRVFDIATGVGAFPEPLVVQPHEHTRKPCQLELAIHSPVDSEAVRAIGVPERFTQVRHLRLSGVVMAVGVRFYTGNFGNGTQLQRVAIQVKVVTGLHTQHSCPAVIAVLVFVHGHGRFHVIQEEFAVHAHRIEQAVVQVKGERAVIHAFGVIALFNE